MNATLPTLLLAVSALLLGASVRPATVDGSSTDSQDRSAPQATPMNKITPFLMFDDQLEAAIEFYAATFPDSEIKSLARAGEDGPVTSAEFVIGGQRFLGFNGGPRFRFSEAFSLFVDCEDQAEVDRYWQKLVDAGAEPTQCGWIRDPYGLSWQVVPRRFTELLRDEDPKKVQAVIQAMLKMQKLDVAALERAYEDA